MSDILAVKRQVELFSEQRSHMLGTIKRENRAFTHAELAEYESLTQAQTALARSQGWGDDIKPSQQPGRGNYYPDIDVGDDGGLSNPFNPSPSQRCSNLDMAIGGWLKNHGGVPIGHDLFEACRSLGVSPNSGAFDVPFERTRPRLGRDWFTRHDRGGAEHRALSAVSGPAGQYTVAGGFIARLEKAMLAQSGMLQSAEVMVTADGAPLPWPTSDDTSNEGALIGENTAVDEQDITFGQVIFYAHKLTSKLVRVSAELLQDSALNLAGEVGQMLGDRIGRIGNRLWTVGTGGGQPEGLVPACTVGVTAASATAITADELIDLEHSVDPSYRQGASFMMSDSTLASIRKLKNGDGDYIFQQGLLAGQPDRLLGYPVVINQHMATIAASAKTIVFGQLSKYKIRLIGGTRLRQLNERYAEYDQTGFLAFLRIDGHLLDAGTNPCKVLQMLA